MRDEAIVIVARGVRPPADLFMVLKDAISQRKEVSRMYFAKGPEYDSHQHFIQRGKTDDGYSSDSRRISRFYFLLHRNKHSFPPNSLHCGNNSRSLRTTIAMLPWQTNVKVKPDSPTCTLETKQDESNTSTKQRELQSNILDDPLDESWWYKQFVIVR